MGPLEVTDRWEQNIPDSCQVLPYSPGGLSRLYPSPTEENNKRKKIKDKRKERTVKRRTEEQEKKNEVRLREIGPLGCCC